MFTTQVAKHLQGEAILTATYLVNRIPFRTLNFKTSAITFLEFYPHFKFVSSIPFKVFGCFAYVYVNHDDKLDLRIIKCIFLGYSTSQKGYKCFFPITKRFYNSMDVRFFQQHPYYSKSGIQGENMTIEYHLWNSISTKFEPLIIPNQFDHIS